MNAALSLSLLCSSVVQVTAFLPAHQFRHAPTWSRTEALCERQCPTDPYNSKEDYDDIAAIDPTDRRGVLQASLLSLSSLILTTTLPSPSNALVKGVAPPPPKKAAGDKPKCTNVEECQAAAEARQQQEAAEAAANAEPVLTTSGGTRYRDLIVGTGRTAQNGNQVTLAYKVLKLGKRSYDGLSGEGTVVFSRGYALEDDEKTVGDKTFITTVGSPLNIVALNEVLVGMQVGGVRRFSVFPAKGWRKPGSACDGGPGGSGAGGELRTDYGKSCDNRGAANHARNSLTLTQ